MIPPTYRLTTGAAQDIREIADWSLERWGRDRTVRYLTEMHERLLFLAANFKMFESNTTHGDLSGGSGLHLYPVNKHYVVFLPLGEQSIAVAAVIRQGRDIPAILQKDGFAFRRDVQDIKDKIAQGLIVPPQD